MTKAELAVIMASVKSYVEGRLSQVSERQGPAGASGRDGIDGKDGAPGPAGAQGERGEYGPQGPCGLRGEVGEPGPQGAPGDRGIDGKGGTTGPTGQQGERGERGLPGESVVGPKGDQGERGAPGESIVGPLGPQGERGLPGESIQGPKGDTGERGEPGNDAVLPDLEPLINRAFDIGLAKWAVDMERRAQDLFQRAIDQMPRPKDGKDGFGLTDFNLEHDGDGNLTFIFRQGELSKSWDIRIPRERHKGVFTEGQKYRAGDTVSFGGSLWIAMKDEPQGKPGDRNTDWILAVKRGRDGRDGQAPPKEGPVKL